MTIDRLPTPDQHTAIVAEDEGLEVVVTPLQLAAVLEGDTIDEKSTVANRFWGAATTVGGALELVGAAALFLTPEPTTITKLGGGVLALHGSDLLSTGIVQIVTGRTRTTLTSQAAKALAEELGAAPGTASTVGAAVDVLVPLAAGFAGVARAIAIRRGAIRLAEEEAAGGHTIARHVARTEEQLRARLIKQPHIRSASTFANLREAETAVSETLRANKTAIQGWAKMAKPGATKAFDFEVQRVVGQGVLRSTNRMESMRRVRVVLEKVTMQNRVYFVLTSYPIP